MSVTEGTVIVTARSPLLLTTNVTRRVRYCCLQLQHVWQKPGEVVLDIV